MRGEYGYAKGTNGNNGGNMYGHCCAECRRREKDNKGESALSAETVTADCVQHRGGNNRQENR